MKSAMGQLRTLSGVGMEPPVGSRGRARGGRSGGNAPEAQSSLARRHGGKYAKFWIF